MREGKGTVGGDPEEECCLICVVDVPRFILRQDAGKGCLEPLLGVRTVRRLTMDVLTVNLVARLPSAKESVGAFEPGDAQLLCQPEIAKIANV